MTDQKIVPFIGYEDAAAAIDWLGRAFGFRERREVRHEDETGTITHAELDLDGALAGRFLRDLRQKLQTWGESEY